MGKCLDKWFKLRAIFSLIYAALNCQFPGASSADSLIEEGMITAWTQSKPEMMDGLGIQQLGSAGVK